MTGSQQDYTASVPASQHSPASTGSMSSTGSYQGYSSRHTNPPPTARPFSSAHVYPAPFVPSPDGVDPGGLGASLPGSCPNNYLPSLNCDNSKAGQHMAGSCSEAGPGPYLPWESPDGVTHYAPAHANYQYDAGFPVVITPPNGTVTSATVPTGVVNNNPPGPMPPPPCDPNHGVTVTMCNNGPGGQQVGPGETQRGGQHTVHFHVHQGEAVSLQLGEQVQMIQGPATVRMVSTNHEPPVPLPVQVPPGHFVHQVVDENGVLQHVILSQHPAYVPVPGGPLVPPQTNGNGSANGWSAPGFVEQTAAAPPPPLTTASYPTSPPPPTYWSNRSESEQPRPSKSNNKRNRDYDRRYKTKPSGSSSPSLSVQSTPPQSPVKPRGNSYNGRGSGSSRGSNPTVDDSEESGIGIEHDEDQEDRKLLLEILSNIRTPSVPEIRARSALLVWSPPVSEPGDPKFDSIKPIPDTDLEYEVLMSDKGKEGKYRSIFSGASMECYLTDLRPHTEYHIRVHAVLKSMNLKGGASDTVSFETHACEPDQPVAPKQITRSKTSIQLRWNAPNDNGAHIQHYILESDEGSSISGQPSGHFVTIYEGRAKVFNVSKLQPSTPYKFRLIAVNELGKSRPSEISTLTTQGSCPGQPVPPSVADISESSMRLLWSKRPCDDEFTLQMDDMVTGHGFLPQYNGPEVEHIISGLRRNTTYRFKLRAHNEMGASQYSTDVSYTTRPGRPGPPPKPQTKGKVRPHSFRVQWNVPADNGGSSLTGYHLETDDGSGWISVYQGEELEFVCDHLQPGTQYRIRVASESAGGVSDYSETCFVTTEPVVPDAPMPPCCLDKPKAMSLHLGWKSPEYDGGAPVTEFEIDMTSPDNLTRGVYRGRDTECVVASLLPGRPYLFQVRAQNRAGVGPWSDSLEVISGAGPPDQPKELRAVSKSGSAAGVSWDPPINNGAIITGYRLELASSSSRCLEVVESESEEEEENVEEDMVDEEEEHHSESEAYDDESESSEADEHVEPSAPANCDTKKESVVTPSDNRILEQQPLKLTELEWKLAYSGSEITTEVRELRPATQYQLRVCAINSTGASPYSCPVSLMTPASVPASPSGLNLSSCTSSSLSLRWRKPTDHGEPITHYNVEWGQQEKELALVNASRKRICLGDLKPDTTYSVRVQAVNLVGSGPFSQMLKVSTRPLPPAPPKLECVSINHNQMKLRWGDSKINIGTNYVLEMENSRKVWYQVYNGNNHTYKVGKLVENMEYRYRISAITEAGQGPFSGVNTFRTAYAPPPTVKGSPRVSGISESGCLVQWTALRNMGAGEHLHYRVQLTRVKDQEVSTYEAGMDVQFRIAGLEPKAEYTVRVCAVRMPNPDSPGQQLVGTYSPVTQLATLPRAGLGASQGRQVQGKQEVVVKSNTDVKTAWSDQQWALVILCGFALFAMVIALIIQQLISLGTVSS